MIPSSHSTPSSGPNPLDGDTALEPGARAVGMSQPFPWSLPADEVATMDRLERGETLELSSTARRCLLRVAALPDYFSDGTFPRALKVCGPSDRPSDEEVTAMIAEVPLFLLSARQRQQALALRQQSLPASGAPAPDFDIHSSRDDLIGATMDALNAAGGGKAILPTKALAKLARWETDVTAQWEAEARAKGGRALRAVVATPLQRSLELGGSPYPCDKDFSLPPRGLIAELGLSQRSLVINLGHARPLDVEAFHDSLRDIDHSHCELALGDAPRESPALISCSARSVRLAGHPDRCRDLALALAREQRQLLEEVSIRRSMPPECMPSLPIGWDIRSTERFTWSLKRASPGAAASAPPSLGETARIQRP